jgi:hypothetical protein
MAWGVDKNYGVAEINRGRPFTQGLGGGVTTQPADNCLFNFRSLYLSGDGMLIRIN